MCRPDKFDVLVAIGVVANWCLVNRCGRIIDANRTTTWRNTKCFALVVACVFHNMRKLAHRQAT